MRAVPALLGVLVLSGPRTAGAGSCARARLVGDPGAVAQVTAELQRLDVTTKDVARCRTIDATVAIEGTGIAVAIADGSHGSEGRVVGDARVAAVWIDSWLRDDFEAIGPAPPPLEAPIAPPRDTVVKSVAPTATWLDRATVAAGFVRSYADGGVFDGASADACVHVGAMCVGARASFGFQGTSPGAIDVRRNAFDAYAIARVGLPLGRSVLSPELGLGLGRLATTRDATCKPPNPTCDPTDPTCPPPPTNCVGPDGMALTGQTVSTIGPRVEAALRIAIPLFERVWLDGSVGLALAPLHHGANSPVDPGTGAGVPPMPGEPLTTYQLAVGLRIGLP